MKKLIISATFFGILGTTNAQVTSGIWQLPTGTVVTSATTSAWRSGKVGIGYTNAPTLIGNLQLTQALGINSDDGTPIPSTTPDIRLQRTYGSGAPWWNITMGGGDLNFACGSGVTSTASNTIFNMQTNGLSAYKNFTLQNNSNLTLQGGSFAIRATPVGSTNVFSVNNQGTVSSGSIQVANGKTLNVGNNFQVAADGSAYMAAISSAPSVGDFFSISHAGTGINLRKPTGAGNSYGDIELISRRNTNVTSSGDIRLMTYDGGNDWDDMMTLTPNTWGGDMNLFGTLTVKNSSGGNEFKVYSDGKVRAREVKVDVQTIPDYVFQPDYKLMPLEDLRNYITEHKHLPNVKSEKEFQEEGSISLGEMNLKLLEKVEELTLYLLQQQTEIEGLKKTISNLKN